MKPLLDYCFEIAIARLESLLLDHQDQFYILSDFRVLLVAGLIL